MAGLRRFERQHQLASTACPGHRAARAAVRRSKPPHRRRFSQSWCIASSIASGGSTRCSTQDCVMKRHARWGGEAAAAATAVPPWRCRARRRGHSASARLCHTRFTICTMSSSFSTCSLPTCRIADVGERRAEHGEAGAGRGSVHAAHADGPPADPVHPLPRASHPLRPVLHGAAPHQRILELLDQGLV